MNQLKVVHWQMRLLIQIRPLVGVLGSDVFDLMAPSFFRLSIHCRELSAEKPQRMAEIRMIASMLVYRRIP
jgi:hypothetical protein